MVINVRPTFLLMALGLLIAFICGIPLYYLLMRAADGGTETWELVFRVRTATILSRTLLLVCLVTFLSTLIGVFLAWVTVRCKLPFNDLVTILLVIPLVVPSFIMATVLIEFFGTGGILANWLGLLKIPSLPGVSGLSGATMTLVIVTYPYVFLSARSAMLRIDPSIEEVSRSLGFGKVNTFKLITLPMLKPSIASGSLLTALYTISDFGAVALMRYETFTFAIFNQYESTVNRSVVAGLSIVLVMFTLVLLITEGMTRSRFRYHGSTSGGAYRVKHILLGRWSGLVFILTIVPVLIGLFVPVGVLIWWLIRGLLAGQAMTPLLQPSINSLFVSITAALLIVLVASPVAFLSAYHGNWRSSRIIERCTYIGFGLPGIVVAISLVFFGINFARPVYQSVWLLLFGYLILFIPVAVGSLKSSLLQVNPSFEEAARGLGARSWQVLKSITVPLISPGIITTTVMIFLLCMKELPATLILSPIGFKTLSTVIWDSSVDAFFSKTAAASLLLILVAGLPMAYMVISNRSYEKRQV